jgi:hypothetical protein
MNYFAEKLQYQHGEKAEGVTEIKKFRLQEEGGGGSVVS